MSTLGSRLCSIWAVLDHVLVKKSCPGVVNTVLYQSNIDMGQQEFYTKLNTNQYLQNQYRLVWTKNSKSLLIIKLMIHFYVRKINANNLKKS